MAKNQIDAGKAFTLLDEKRANTFLYPYGYLASRKEGIRSMGESLTQNGGKVKSKFSLKAPVEETKTLLAITNANPTSDPDIRYSLKGEYDSEKVAWEQEELRSLPARGAWIEIA